MILNLNSIVNSNGERLSRSGQENSALNAV